MAVSGGHTGKCRPASEAYTPLCFALRMRGAYGNLLAPTVGMIAAPGDKSVRWVDADYAVDEFYSQYVLGIDEDYVLRIYGYLDGPNGDLVRREVWSNIRRAMTEGDFMLQGDIIWGMNENGEETYMTLQHDCNLVQRYGKDTADSSCKIWASGSDERSDPEDVN
jgi:hypothetical protein